MSDDQVQRRLAAIFYADVAGYSRLTGDDELGTHRRLSTHLDLLTSSIETQSGRVVHFAGDAILAEFGSVVDAVTAAVNAQRELAQRDRAARALGAGRNRGCGYNREPPEGRAEAGVGPGQASGGLPPSNSASGSSFRSGSPRAAWSRRATANRSRYRTTIPMPGAR